MLSTAGAVAGINNSVLATNWDFVPYLIHQHIHLSHIVASEGDVVR